MFKLTRLLLISFVLVSVVAITGCGGGGSDEDQIRAVSQSAEKAYNNKDWNKFCSLLTPASVKNQLKYAEIIPAMEGKEKTCPNMMEAIAADPVFNLEAPIEADIKVDDIKVDGNTATAVSKVEDETVSLNFEKIDGEWLITEDDSDNEE